MTIPKDRDIWTAVHQVSDSRQEPRLDPLPFLPEVYLHSPWRDLLLLLPHIVSNGTLSSTPRAFLKFTVGLSLLMSQPPSQVRIYKPQLEGGTEFHRLRASTATDVIDQA